MRTNPDERPGRAGARRGALDDERRALRAGRGGTPATAPWTPAPTTTTSAVRTGRPGHAPRRAFAAASAAATRSGAVPPVTSADASEPSMVAAAAARPRSPSRCARRRAVGVVRAVERGAERLVREPGERRDALGLGPAHEPADDVVGDPERDAAPDEGIRERRGGGVALLGGLAHPRAIDRERLDEPGHDAERGVQRRDRGEERRLVLLEVALVRERQALEQREHGGQRADDRRGAARGPAPPGPGSSCWASSRSRWRTRRRRARTRSAGSTTR